MYNKVHTEFPFLTRRKYTKSFHSGLGVSNREIEESTIGGSIVGNRKYTKSLPSEQWNLILKYKADSSDYPACWKDISEAEKLPRMSLLTCLILKLTLLLKGTVQRTVR
jgi:hypothetical protein